MYYDDGLNDLQEGIYVCQRIAKEKFEWVLVSRALWSDPEIVANHKVVCVKSDGKLGVCINNPSMDGTCGCY